MQDHRAFVIGRDGHILQRREFLCADEDVAKERAKRIGEWLRRGAMASRPEDCDLPAQ
jgi:hypothetical protein